MWRGEWLSSSLRRVAKPIAVLGATGYTGRLVARELKALGAPLRLVARDEAALDALRKELGDAEVAQATSDNPEALRAALRGCSVAASTIGPFTIHGAPVMHAALESGCHWVDTTGEQAWLRRVAAKWAPEAAQRKLAVAPGCGYEWTAGDDAAALAANGLGALDSVEVTYFASGGMSRGTRLSGAEIILEEGAVALQDGVLLPMKPGAVHEARFPDKPRHAIDFPGGECVMLPHHLAVRNVATRLTLPPAAARFAPLVFRVARRFPNVARRIAARGARGPAEEARTHARFAVLAVARGPAGSRSVTVAGKDPYGLTGAVIARFAVELAKGGKSGFVAPSEIVDPEALFKELGARFDVRIL